MLSNEELLKIKGGAVSSKIASCIGVAIVFLIGIIDGIINPKKCN